MEASNNSGEQPRRPSTESLKHARSAYGTIAGNSEPRVLGDSPQLDELRALAQLSGVQLNDARWQVCVCGSAGAHTPLDGP